MDDALGDVAKRCPPLRKADGMRVPIRNRPLSELPRPEEIFIEAASCSAAASVRQFLRSGMRRSADRSGRP